VICFIVLGYLASSFRAAIKTALASQITWRCRISNMVLWAIVFGLIIANRLGCPSCSNRAWQPTVWLKDGIVLLGQRFMLAAIVLKLGGVSWQLVVNRG